MNQKLSLSSIPESDDRLAPSDDAVRQALLRMGSGKPQGGQGNGKNQAAKSQGASGGQMAQRRGGDQIGPGMSGDSRRRRFTQNENVPVEYVSRDRQPGRADAARFEPGRPEAAEQSGPTPAQFERERMARETAERALVDAQKALQAVQTRLKHVEFELDELRAARAAELALALANAAQAGGPVPGLQDGEADELAIPRRGRGRPRILRAAEPEAEEPEPVTWWIRD